MAYGFVAVNDSGIVQIDGAYTNYSLASKGSVTLTEQSMYLGASGAGDVYGTCYIADVAYTAPDPLFVLENTSGVPVVVISTANVGPNMWQTRLMALAPVSVGYFVFSSNVVVAGAGYGLIVYDGAGRPVASSNMKYPLIRQVVSGNVIGAGPDYGQYNYAAATSFSATFTPGGGRMGVGAIRTPSTQFNGSLLSGAWRGNIGFGGWMTGSGTATFSTFNWRFGPSSPNPPNFQYDYQSALDYGGILIDVSNL